MKKKLSFYNVKWICIWKYGMNKMLLVENCILQMTSVKNESQECMNIFLAIAYISPILIINFQKNISESAIKKFWKDFLKTLYPSKYWLEKSNNFWNSSTWLFEISIQKVISDLVFCSSALTKYFIEKQHLKIYIT